jgi:glycosyltransferase involved in cell wall biosynthesis
MKIFCNTPGSDTSEGYGYALHMLRSEFKKEGIVIDTLKDIETGNCAEVPPNIGYEEVPSITIGGSYDIVINNCLPVTYIKSDAYNIGFTYWESSKVPDCWVEPMRQSDEIWTTSEWCKSVFEDQGLNSNIRGFDLGIDTSTYRIGEASPSGETFKFLHVGSPSTRKNVQMVIDVFLDLFDGDPKYELIIKAKGYTEGRIMKGGVIIGAPSTHPQITVITDIVEEHELASLYRSVHCMVYPTSGEGWGLIPFSSMASGTPTICTNATSCTEFASLGLPLNYSTVPADPGAETIYSGSEWASPDYRHLLTLMHLVVDDYKAQKERAVKNAAVIHKKYSWNKVASKYIDRLCRIEQSII